MHNSKKNKSNPNSIYRFFLVSYISILLLALSSCVVYGFKIQSQTMQENNLSHQVLLSSLRSDIETNLLYIQERCNSLAFNSTVQLYVGHPELYDRANVMRELSTDGAMADYLLDTFLYIPSSDEIITSSISMDADRFFDIMYEFEELSPEDVKNKYLLSYHFHDYMDTLTIRQYASSSQCQVIPFIQSLPIRSVEEPQAQLIFLLDVDKMFARAQALHVGTDLPVYILDNNKRLIYSSPGAPALDADALNGTSSTVRLSGAVATRLISDSTGWQYLVATPNAVYYQKSVSNFLFLGIIFLLYLAVGLVLVRRLARRSYRPVKDISDLILRQQPASETADTQNEYDIIRHTLLSQMKSHSEMRTLLEAQQPVMLRDCLTRLIHGQVRDFEAARKRLHNLGIRPTDERFLCVLSEIDNDSPFFLDSNSSSEENLPLARLIVQNVGCELLEKDFGCCHLDLNANQILFLLWPKEQHQAFDIPTVADTLQKLSQFCVSHFALNLLLGIGQEQSGLEHLSLCFDEARKALEYSRYQPCAEPVQFSQTIDAESEYYFPPACEQDLLELLRSGSSTEAHALLAQIFQTNFESKKISTLAARDLLYQLTSIFQRVINANSLAQGNGTVFDEQMVEHILHSSSIEHARMRLDALIDQLALQRQDHPLSRTEKLAENIAEYIDTHIEDAWLDLNSLSEQFSVTPQYISNIFKKYRNENIKDYVAKRKLAHAKELLSTTSLTVKEIAQRLGYANEISVIRLFKKYEGVTPGDYRQTHCS